MKSFLKDERIPSLTFRVTRIQQAQLQHPHVHWNELDGQLSHAEFTQDFLVNMHFAVVIVFGHP